MSRPPKTVSELRDDLLRIYAAVGTRDVDIAVAKEKSNAAGKILKSVAVQLEYHAMRKETPEIQFMETGELAQPRKKK